MLNQVFSVSGNKIASFVADADSLKFSSSNFTSVDEFLASFGKKLSLATKVEIKYDSIKSIQKEDNDKTIAIKYKGIGGITSSCEFSFANESDYEVFFNYLEKERYFKRTAATMTPIKAVGNYLLGLLLTIGLTIFAYYQAVGIANGTLEDSGNRKTRAFNALVGLLGDKGVLAVGALIACYLIYKIWTRFKNPPNQTKFIAPNGY
ncbi:hypothetical protein A4H97_08205 [Niastella yeongjuensis]|uniref:Uncharacterized protein n=1 Tax=Niastella yeongjuensis TaxID=354355 RepID=A0A1V9END6_9BACT|nr:hypothetical protein [Niastella yeongjuensis]OQP47464.1 hypothetical protein A4H97_08205 [Niastella yeongjuensis]SEN85522.1 hypothetical protein SAMN05660816_01667 [Niastella yeongjuensis]